MACRKINSVLSLGALRSSWWVLLWFMLPISEVAADVSSTTTTGNFRKNDPSPALRQHQIKDTTSRQHDNIINITTSATPSSSYIPQYLKRNSCLTVSDEECQELDRAMQRHIASHQRIMQMQKERRQTALGPQGDDNQNAPRLGTVNPLVLLIQFRDHQTNRQLPPKTFVEETWNTEIRRWFRENSQGVYEIGEVRVINWFLTDNTEEYYSFGVSGLTSELQKAMWPALDMLDNRKDWDWSDFDVDQDGEIDSVVMMHSGYDGILAGPDCTGRDMHLRIQPHAFSSSIKSWRSKDGIHRLNGYTVTSAFNNLCDEEPFTPGLLVHEYMHTFGLPDLYDGTTFVDALGLGVWDIMSYPYGPDDSGHPSFISAWSRMNATWLTPEVITSDGPYTIKAAETSNQAYRIDLIPPSDRDDYIPEYILLENRQLISFDKTLPDFGIMMYHIDNAADGQENAGFPGQPGWPHNGKHYKVAVMPKDGNYDLEKGNNWGDEGDMWKPGNVLGPGKKSTVFPNTDSYQNGKVAETGIMICIHGYEEESSDMTFEVAGLSSPGSTCEPLGGYADAPILPEEAEEENGGEDTSEGDDNPALENDEDNGDTDTPEENEEEESDNDISTGILSKPCGMFQPCASEPDDDFIFIAVLENKSAAATKRHGHDTVGILMSLASWLLLPIIPAML